jgi:hypothetical protein
MYGPREEIT